MFVGIADQLSHAIDINQDKPLRHESTVGRCEAFAAVDLVVVVSPE